MKKKMASWTDCEEMLVEINRHRRRIGWERWEEILLRIIAEIEAYTERRMRFQPEHRIIARIVKYRQRIIKELVRIVKKEGAARAAPFFGHLRRKIFRRLHISLMRGAGKL